ncbi:MAG: AAA family ATPase, partial [Planctomycetaceae bacterium]|nr:AAA family ATPase [Planctomycetaceae bacterium]
DRLPYTTEFDYLYQKFKQNAKRKFSKNDFWRYVLSVAKSKLKQQLIDNNLNDKLSRNQLKDLRGMNPWWKNDCLIEVPENKRQNYQILFDYLLNGLPIVVLRGPRQVGKSTIQLQIIRDLLEQHGVSPKQIFRVQFDELSTLTLNDPIVRIINWYEEKVVKDTFNNLAHQGKKIYIFLDEIQDVDNWSAQLKHIVDHEMCHVFVTGSSAIRIFAGRESLAGRAYWNEINTLGLSEICRFRKLGNLPPYKTGSINLVDFRNKKFWIDFKNWYVDEQLLDKVYKTFCEFGGYPYCHTSNNTLHEMTNEYIIGTVVARTIDQDLKVNFDSEYKNKSASLTSTLLTKAFKTLCKYSGMIIGVDKLRKEFHANFSESLTDKQIQLILDFFDNSMLIKVIYSFEHHLKRAKTEKKFCLCDHSIRKALLNEYVDLYGKSATSNIAGYIAEGIVGTFLSSIENVELSYLRDGNSRNENGREIDYILEVGDGHIPIEVKYREHPDLNTGIDTFIKNPANNATFGLVITKNEVPIDYFKNENIIPISLKKLLLLK